MADRLKFPFRLVDIETRYTGQSEGALLSVSCCSFLWRAAGEGGAGADADIEMGCADVAVVERDQLPRRHLPGEVVGEAVNDKVV